MAKRACPMEGMEIKMSVCVSVEKLLDIFVYVQTS